MRRNRNRAYGLDCGSFMYQLLVYGNLSNLLVLILQKNECMFEKMLGKRTKTRYDVYINDNEGSEFSVRSSCCIRNGIAPDRETIR